MPLMVCEGSQELLLSHDVVAGEELVVYAKGSKVVFCQHSFLCEPPKNQHYSSIYGILLPHVYYLHS